MFLTRSIRRKLVISLALVSLMLSILAFGAISGLSSYRSVINDLDYTITVAPRHGDLPAAIAHLNQPLLNEGWELMADEAAKAANRARWKKQIDSARADVLQFHVRLEQSRPSKIAWEQESIVRTMLTDLDGWLDDFEKYVLDGEVSPRLYKGKHRTVVKELWEQVVEMSDIAASVPTPEDHLEEQLNQARAVYRSRFYLVCIALVLNVLIFVGLIRCAYLWIFAPIKILHQGAQRVAAGDFDFRVKLTGQDEMAELAGTFNQVVDRFQEIKSKLDKEVHERSRQLIRSEKLAGLGFLAAGVAHEINNPLSAIAMASESLESRLHEPAFADGHPGPDDLSLVTSYLSMIQKEAFRCKQITARLLDFARGQDAPKTRQDLVKIVSEVLDLVSHLSAFRGHTIYFDRQRTCYAEVNGGELKQVVLNMISNAIEAMQGQGTVKIDIEERADEVILSFRDNGCGMTPYVLENLFEPFFTERKSGKGTGLGLSISHRIISEHGGRIEPFSDGPGTGSLFRIHLPRKARAQLVKAA